MTDNSRPVDALNDITKIVIVALCIALVGITVVGVVIGFEARSTQNNADSNARALEDLTVLLDNVTAQNQALNGELGCLRLPAFEADAADAALAIITARGLAAVAAGEPEILASLKQDLTDGADDLEDKVEVRKLSITECSEDPTWVPTETLP